MTAPTRPKCTHCGEHPDVRTIQPAAPRARAVIVGLCACDWLSCGTCDRSIRTAKVPSRCPHCGGDPFRKKEDKKR